MSDITPEMLKIIATGMAEGKSWLMPKIKTTKPGCWRTDPDIECLPYVFVNGSEYNPLSNAEQCMEIMEKHVNTVTFVNTCHGKYRAIIEHTCGYGETIPEAVCKAAFEYFSEIKE